MYMNYVWDAASRSTFLASSHRSRYLNSDGLISIPPNTTPLYAIQFASASNYPLYATETDSLVILATESAPFLLSCTEAVEAMGRWPSKKATSFPDAGSRLAGARELWKDEKGAVAKILEEFKMVDMESLYEAVVARCRPGELSATFDAEEFRSSILPRPSAPEAGIPLGPSSDPSDPPAPLPEEYSHRSSTRGISRKRKRNRSPPQKDPSTGADSPA